MHLRPVLLLALAPSFGRICASGRPQPTQPFFSLLPAEINDIIFSQEGMGLVEYAAALDTTGGAPLVTPDVEERLLSHAAEEVKRLDIYNDDQRARLSHILEATRAVVGQRSALPTTIPPKTDTNTLKKWALRFVSTFYEYSSLSSSPTWLKCCMAALLGKDTLIKLLPSLSEGFVNSHMRSMLQAAALVTDFDTLIAVAAHPGFSSSLKGCIKEDALFGGSVDFVRNIVEFVPEFIKDWSVLEAAVKLNHRPLFNYLYAETMKQKDQQETLNDRIARVRGITRALEALAGRGWKGEFKQLHSEHPQLFDAEKCLIAAAKHGRIEILKYLLVDNEKLAEEARPHINTAFELAVGFGNIDAINFLLGDERGNTITFDLFLTQPTPTMFRAVGESGRWEGIEYLMQLGQRGDARFAQFQLDGDASDGVKMACKHGHLQVLEKLLQKDNGHLVFTFEDPRKTFQESLGLACQHGHLLIVQELLRKDRYGNYVYPGINTAAEDNKALISACENGHILVVQELLRKDKKGNYVHQGIDPAAGDNKALRKACKNGHILVFQELLRKDRDGNYVYQGIDPAARNNWALILACENGHILVVRELLRKDKKGNYVHQGIDPSAWNNWALIRACVKGHILVVQELLRKDKKGNYVYQGINPAAYQNLALIRACTKGHILVVRELLRKDKKGNYVHQGIKPFVKKNEALIRACENGHILVVQELLRKDRDGNYVYQGIDPAARNNLALLCACENGHILVVQELLRKDKKGNYVHQGIDPAVSKNTALIGACENGHILVVQELLRKDKKGNYVHQGIKPSAWNNLALLHACENGHILVVQELLRKDKKGNYVHQGIDPAVGENEALRKACKNGHRMVVQELLRKDKKGNYVHQGIAPAVEDNRLLVRAYEKGNLPVVQELLQAGCNCALIRACSQGHLLMVRELLRKDGDGHYVYQGIDPAARNNAPLIEACGKGHLDIVKLLLQGRPNARGVIEYEHDGIDAAAQSNKALWRAIEAQQTEIVEFLLQKTEEEEYIFPGIRVTNKMRLLAASVDNPKLGELLGCLPDTVWCAIL